MPYCIGETRRPRCNLEVVAVQLDEKHQSCISFIINPESINYRLFEKDPGVFLDMKPTPITLPRIIVRERGFIDCNYQDAYSQVYEFLKPLQIRSVDKEKLGFWLLKQARDKINRKHPGSKLTKIHVYLQLSTTYYWINTVPASPSCIGALDAGRLMDFRGQDCYVDKSCSVCLDEFHHMSMVKRMPCKHMFHGKCIKVWLSKNRYCPICRFEMPSCEVLETSCRLNIM